MNKRAVSSQAKERIMHRGEFIITGGVMSGKREVRNAEKTGR